MILGSVAWTLGLVPALWLAGLAGRRRSLPPWTWAMAGGFGVSWIADAIARWVGAGPVSQVYPVMQAAVFTAVLVPRHWAENVIALFLLAASASIVMRQGIGLDILLHVLAWGTVAGLAWRYTAHGLRGALLVYFGLGVLAWLGYVVWPGWGSWLTYQGTRAVGLGWWCWTVWRVTSRRVPA